MDAITTKLINERSELVRKAEDIKQRAFDDNERDLVDTERSTLGNISARVRGIDEQLTLTATDLSLSEDIAAGIARYAGAPVETRGGMPWTNAGECLWDWLHQADDTSARERVRGFQRMSQRAAQHMGTVAANTVTTAGGFGALAVSAQVGPVIVLGWSGMPFANAIGLTDLPSANTYMRPRLVDPDFDTAAGPQAGGKEKAELPSKKWDYASDPLTWTGVGNYINLSIQASTMVAGALDQVITHLGRRTTRGIEKNIVAVLASATKKITLGATADAIAVQKAIGEAYTAVVQATGEPPTWIAYGPTGAGRLLGLTDLAGRPLYPQLGATNASGTSGGANDLVPVSTVAGLRSVLTPAITDGTFYVGNSLGLEAYIHRLPLLRATEPSVMGEQIAVAALVSTYQVPTTEAGPANTPPAKYEAIVKLAP